MAKRFKNPPVVEVWLSFEFDPNENKREWDLELVKQYLLRFVAEFPRVEATHERKIDVQESSPNELPKVVRQQVKLTHARIFNEQKTRVLQIGEDRISYHVVKSEAGYPGYLAVRDQAIEKVRDYIDLFQPARIRNAALHYVDIVEIPKPESGQIDLADYFVGSADLPEKPFGFVGQVSVQFAVGCPVDDGPLFLQIKTLPAAQESNVFRFGMEWRKLLIGINCLDLVQVCDRLDVAHAYMTDCFLATVTERTLALFQPINED